MFVPSPKAVVLALTLTSIVSCAESGEALSDEALNRVVEESSSTLRDCAGSTTEEVSVVLQIAASGAVQEARADGSPRVAACVERVVRTWEFPSAERGVDATLPLTIHPVDEAE